MKHFRSFKQPIAGALIRDAIEINSDQTKSNEILFFEERGIRSNTREKPQGAG